MKIFAMDGTIHNELSIHDNSGKKRVEFTLYCHGKDGGEYFNMKAFGYTADFIEKYFGAGQPISCTGEIRQSKWEYEGQTKSKIEFIIEKVFFVPKEFKNDGQRPSRPAAQKPQVADAKNAPPSFGDDFVPF